VGDLVDVVWCGYDELEDRFSGGCERPQRLGVDPNVFHVYPIETPQLG
jgi:hypothetical protein